MPSIRMLLVSLGVISVMPACLAAEWEHTAATYGNSRQECVAGNVFEKWTSQENELAEPTGYALVCRRRSLARPTLFGGISGKSNTPLMDMSPV